MRLVVTGREGQVASSLAERAQVHDGIELVRLGRPEFDLLQPSSIYEAISAARPDVLISAAAYTAVDLAEDEPDLAHAANAVGAGLVSRAAAAAGAPVIHLSTDYVFSGNKHGDYEETDATGPQCVYGRTKLEGEILVAALNPRHIVLRTAWVYSPFGRNFVKTMLRLARERDEIAVVADQWGNPTSALDIADGILHIARAMLDREREPTYGIYHLAGAGVTNWSGLAEHILGASRDHGGPWARVKAIGSAHYPTKARRPANSRLSVERLADAFGWRAPDWRVSADATVRRLLQASPETD